MPQTVQWFGPNEFAQLLSRSAEENKPVLLDLHSPECPGCQNHDQTIYSNPTVTQEIADHTLPVRVITQNPDKASTDIIDQHIFIWSPTVQLLAPDGTRYHEFNGAPRRTRLSSGYETVRIIQNAPFHEHHRRSRACR